jgi:Na+-transporting NADH:ubiquinone oxidoreductase subunit C
VTAEREPVGRTLAVAAAVALFCSLLVSTTVYWLRPIQLAYRSLEHNRAVLVAAGLIGLEDVLADRDLVDRFLALDARIVELDAGAYADTDAVTAAGFDYRSAIDDPRATREIGHEQDVAGLGKRPRRMPVYVLLQGSSVERIVLPVYGRGMWSTIHGFICLGPDLTSIAGVRFYEHGETPGIGDRIQNPAWTAQWIGKRAYADDGTLVLRIGADFGSVAAPARIDAITGATVTVTAVERLVRYWLGVDGYGPFLASLRAGR